GNRAAITTDLPDMPVPEGILGKSQAPRRESIPHDQQLERILSRSPPPRDLGRRQVRFCRSQGGPRVTADPEPVSIRQARHYAANSRTLVPYARPRVAALEHGRRPSRALTFLRSPVELRGSGCTMIDRRLACSFGLAGRRASAKERACSP